MTPEEAKSLGLPDPSNLPVTQDDAANLGLPNTDDIVAKTSIGKDFTIPYNVVEKGVIPAFTSILSSLREFNKVRQGMLDLGDRAISGMSLEAQDRIKERAAQQELQDEGFRALEKQNPNEAMLGGLAPYVLSAPILSAPKMVARPTINAMLQGGLEGLLQGAAHYDESALGGMAQGAVGGAIGQAIGHAMGTSINKLSDDAQRVVDYAMSKDLFVPPGMRTGNRVLQQIDSSMKTDKATTDLMHDKLVRSKELENRILSKELGGPETDSLTRGYLDDQRKRIANDMNSLVSGTEGYVLDDDVLKVMDINQEYRDISPDQQAPPILNRYEDDLLRLLDDNTPMSGEHFQESTKKLNKAASLAYARGDSALGKALSKLSSVYGDVIDRGVASTLGESAAKSWRKARKEYALLSSIEQTKNVTNIKGASGIEGFVDVNKLAKKFKSSDEVNKLAEVERLRRAQYGSSLGVSSLLGKMLSDPLDPESAGAAMLLTSKVTGGLPVIPNLLTNLYLKGYPHATGYAPIFGKATEPVLQTMGIRSTMGNE